MEFRYPRPCMALVALAFIACDGGPVGGPCVSSRDCSSNNLVCDTTRRECVECVGDADCLGEAEVCVARACVMVVACASSRQCPGQVCDTGRGYCVDCVSDVDCEEGLSCEDSVCVEPPPPCASDRECSSLGMVCDPTLRICVECVADTDCVEGFSCAADQMCRVGMMGCMPGAAECVSGSAARRCGSDGSWGVATPCLAGQTCAGGLCIDRSCDPACSSDEVCVDGACMALRCSPGCTGDEACVGGVCRCGERARCEAGSECVTGVCIPTGCAPACDVGESCSDGTCLCGSGPACTGSDVCAESRCAPPACAPSCDPGETCVGGGCRCGAGPSCGSGETCEAGACQPIRCVPACAAGETCSAGTCRCGTGPACSGSQSCVAGRCEVPSVCRESPCRLVSPQCGCAAGQACDVIGTARACVAPGTRGEGQACDASTPCAAGLTCLGPSGTQYCVRWCSSDSDCPGGAGSLCELNLVDSMGTPVPAASMLCGVSCDPITSAGCRSSTACEINAVRATTSAAVTLCRAITTFPFPGFPCTDNSFCAAGEVCVSTACHPYCRIGVPLDCPSGQVCNAFSDRPRLGTREYGYCL